MRNKIDVAQNVIEVEIEDLLSKAFLTASAMRVHQNLSEALVNNDRERIAIIANSLKNMAYLDFCTIVDKDGIVVVRAHDPDNYGDSLMGLSHVQSAFENKIESYVVPGVSIRLGVMAGAPIYDLNENIIGAISLGFRLDSQAFVERLSQLTECEVAVYLHDELISSTVINGNGTFALGRSADENISKKVLAGESFSGRVQISGKNLISNYAPLSGVNDEVVGMIFVGYNTAEATRDIIFFIIFGIVVTLIVLAVCIILAQHISKTIEGRLNKAHNHTKQFLESMDTMVVVTEIESDKILYLNDSFKKEFDFADDVIGTECWKILVDGAAGRCDFCPKHDMDLNSDKIISWEFFNPKLQKHYRITSRFIDWIDGSKVFVEQCVDITEIKESMEKMREANERMTAAHSTTSAMFESNPHINILFDSNFNLIDCNPASLIFMGCETKEELIGSFVERMAKFLPEHQPDGRRTLPLAERLMMAAKEGYHKISTVIYLGDKPKYLDMEFKKIPYEDSFAITAYVQDMTELREQEARLVRILNSISAMIYVTDIKTDEILFINDYMKEHFKIDNDVIGQPCYKVLNQGIEQRCDWCPCHQLDIEPNKEVVWDEFNTLTKRHYLNSDRYIEWANGKKAHIQLCLDVSETREREAELAQINDVNELHLIKLNTVIKAAKIALWDAEINLDNPMDPNTPVMWSDEFKGMLGYSSTEDFPNVFTSWINCLHPDDAENILNAFAGHLLDTTGKTPFNVEYRLRKKNGEYAYFLAAGSAIRNAEGAAVRVAGALMDISEAREREVELVRINEANELHLIKLNTVIKAAKIALWDAEINLDNPMDANTPVMWTDEFRGMIGYSSSEDFPNVFTSWIACLHPDDAESTLTAFAGHLLDTTGKTPFNVEYRLRKKNGEYAHFLAAGSAIRNAEGAAVRVAGALMDISEMKNLQLNLEHERAMLQLMFDSSPDHIFCKDANFIYTRCNETLLKYHGIAKENLIGKDDKSGLGIATKFAEEYRATDSAVLTENKASVHEERVPSSDGTVRLFETNKVPLILNGEAVGIMGVARDITERKEMEEAAQSANRSKTVFLANMSHEIRTPMNSIIGFSELAQSDDISNKTRNYLSNIQDSAEWMLKIINDILDISKIESGKIEFENIPFDLPDIFAHCQSAIMPKIAEKGIMLYCYAEPSIGKKLLGDPLRLRQIIMNLLSNAVKFTNSGTVKFLASILSTDENSVTIQFEIKDSGIGMTPEQIERIFNPFTQAEDSITRRFGGTGLGLTITKNIVDLMGGTLNVESAPGVGSKFTFELTFGLIDETEIPHEKIVINDFEKPNFKGEVLVCEDNSLNQQVICDHLGRVGLKSVVAQNGKEGVDIVRKRKKNNEPPFDLIFMDIHMPVMDGLDAAARITKMGVKTPIVALTANIMSNDIEHYKTSGMYDTVGKPFTTQELWRCLAKYIPIEGYTVIDKRRAAAEESKAQKMIKTNFVKNNQTTYNDIISAVDIGDIKTAHRLAHTLKSNAGQMGKKELQTAAFKVEASLAHENAMLKDEEMNVLKTELDLVLSELAPLLNEMRDINKTDTVDMEKTIKLFDTLENLLNKKNTDCIDLIDELYDIPNTEELITHIEGYKFWDALTSLNNLRKDLVSGNE